MNADIAAGQDVQGMLGDALRSQRLGHHDEAARLYSSVLQVAPDEPVALHLLGVLHLKAGNAAAAARVLEHLVRVQPQHHEALNNLGNALQLLNRHGEAVDRYHQALRIKPELAEAYDNLGLALRALGRHGDAVDAFGSAIRIKPGLATAHYNLGDALQALGRHADAIPSYEEAIRLKPDFAQACNNLGIALDVLFRHSAAVAAYADALRIRPDFVQAQSNMGCSLQCLERHEEAIECFERTLRLAPGFVEIAYSMSASMLALRLSERAWRQYESRLHPARKDALPELGLPLWLGEQSLRGRKILIQWEQRAGDVLQMLRYIPLVEGMGAECHLQAARPLRALIARSFPFTSVVGARKCPPGIDYRIPYTSLPLAMKTFAESEIPRQTPYLTPDPARVTRWRGLLDTRDALTVGVAWRGKPNPVGRSIPLELLCTLFGQPRVSFIALQKDLTDGEAAILGGLANVRSLDEELDTFDDTAAVVDALDLVITIDTSVAHLSGALGKPTWVMLKYGADWRWLLRRADSPWYPSVRLFRQSAPGNWESVLQEVGLALRQWPRTAAP